MLKPSIYPRYFRCSSVCLVYSSFHHGMNIRSLSPCFYFKISHLPCCSLFRLDLFYKFFTDRRLTVVLLALCLFVCVGISRRGSLPNKELTFWNICLICQMLYMRGDIKCRLDS